MRVVASLALAAGLALPLCAADGYPSGPGGRPMYGVEMSPVPINVQSREGLAVDQGVYVRQTFPNTAAAAANVQPGDVILSINNQPITSMTDLRNEIGLTNVGDPVNVVVARNGERLELSSNVKPWPASIPYEPIDPAVEERFRDWQKRRVERQQQQLQQVAADLDELSKDMAEAKQAQPWTKASAFGELATYLAFLPAWKVSVRDGLDAATLPQPVDLDPVGIPVDEPAQAAWRVSWRTGKAD